MSSKEETTLQRIQREISEVLQREKELKSSYNSHGLANGRYSGPHSLETEPLENGHESPQNGHISENGSLSLPNTLSNGDVPILSRNYSITTNIETPTAFNNRRFLPNMGAKGVMQRFLKSRGKLSAVAAISEPATKVWIPVEVMEPPKVSAMPPGKPIRNGYVSVEERIKKEFQDMQHREHELKLERSKSQSDLLDLSDDEPFQSKDLRASKSMAQLYDSDDCFEESAPGSLKPARSLAELCDADEDELQTPGSLNLIKQWETIIQKNQQART